MMFLTPGQKVKRLRIQLDLKQDDLKSENVTRGLISMIETDRRDITPSTAVKLSEKFNARAEELNTIVNVDAEYLMRSPEEDAKVYCKKRLEDPDLRKFSLEEVFEIIQDYELIEIKADAYCRLGEMQHREKKTNEAFESYKKAMEIYTSINKSDRLGYVYFRMGALKNEELNHDAAIEYYQLSKHYCTLYNDYDTMKLCFLNAGKCYKAMNSISLALENIQGALSMCNEEKDFDVYIEASIQKGICYNRTENYEKAIEIFKELLNKAEDKESLKVACIYKNLGITYCKTNGLNQSLRYFQLAENIISKKKAAGIASITIEKAEVLIKQKNFKEAIETIKQGLDYANEYNAFEAMVKGHELLAKVYYELDDNLNLEKIYLELIALIEAKGNKEAMRAVYNKMALHYSKLGKVDLCEKYLIRAMEISKK